MERDMIGMNPDTQRSVDGEHLEDTIKRDQIKTLEKENAKLKQQLEEKFSREKLEGE